MESDPKVSTPHFKSSEALLSCNDHPGVKPVLVSVGHWDSLRKLDPNIPNHGKGYT